MKTLLAASLVLIASIASYATPLENAAALAASLGVKVAPAALPAVEAPRASAVVLRAEAAPAKTVAATSTLTAPASGPLSGYINVTGNGSLMCSGGPRGSGWMNGWVNLSANVQVTTNDGASGYVYMTGSAFLSGSCQNGGGFVNGNALISGSGALYKAGKYVGTASLSSNAFINQYVSGGFAWINQSVYVTGRFDTNGVR